ncbi:glycosyltransferase [Dyadobacter sp. CY312]|uniref:glycosyltransferase n=1 Tax=Dyadobacter sp. CY312 TaxID=2907303 RepID=UPI001F1B9BC8|nr:glycosyltransferase [Dyadobacter sp. CY312]MCE7041475.1 glycosyltransferase [Dyadobacter sp. CY312]
MKLNGHKIIIFGLPRMDSEIESTNYTTARLLAKTNRVYYVENPYTLKDYFRLRNSKQGQRRKGYFSLFNTSLIDTDVPGLSVIIPPVLLSINFLPEGFLFRMALEINEFILAFKLKRFQKKYAINDFIFINSFNFHYPGLASYLKPALEVYHCLDPLVVAFDKKHGLLSEKKIIIRSDVVICSSRKLYHDKVVLNSASHFVPNAADVTHSSKVLDPQLQVSHLLADLPRPVIGYFGAIERRIDYDLLGEVSRNNSDKTFVLVGPITSEFVPAWFTALPNVKMTGAVPYTEMPAVVKGFDVALIPFRKDEVSRTIFPLKLFEYLGAGKPVVCTDFNPDLAEFTGETVPFCSTAESFSKAIAVALSSNGEHDVAERLQIAAANTWERRVDEIADIIYEELIRSTGKYLD